MKNRNLNQEHFSAILFDLDGTLLDTLQDLADSMNASLLTLGFPAHPTDQYRYFVGDGVDILAKRCLPADKLSPQMIQQCALLHKKNYSTRWDKKTRPYPGINKMLSDLQLMGIPKAILSNKPDDFTKLVVAKLLPDFTFDIVRGANGGFPRKPDPAAAIDIARQLNIPANKFLYLGDTNTDMQTAKAAGMYAVGALWGFRQADELLANGAKALVSSPDEVVDILKKKSE
jgi:phosphoglycolate phosphatase